jgi:hypothetical protein
MVLSSRETPELPDLDLMEGLAGYGITVKGNHRRCNRNYYGSSEGCHVVAEL